MANILGAITAVVLAIAAFIAMKNKDAYQLEINNAKAAKSKLEAAVKRLETANKSKEKTIADRKAVEERTLANSTGSGSLNEQKTALERTNADLTSQRDAKAAKINENKTKLEEIREKSAKTGDLKDLAAKMKVTNQELTELRASTEQAEGRLAAITNENKATEASITGLQNKITLLTSGKSLPTLRTTIRSVYPTWGFVTLGAGNNSGVVNNSTLHVTRDGEVIAKLLVTAVESNRSSATIVPDSIAADTTLMAGDRVVAPDFPTPPASMPAPAPSNTPANPADAPPAPEPDADPAPAPEGTPAAPDTTSTPDPFSAPAGDATTPAAPAAENSDPFSN